VSSISGDERERASVVNRLVVSRWRGKVDNCIKVQGSMEELKMGY
jgi:hypothetical protein